jgi:isoleucyl-tRNA synthetase
MFGLTLLVVPERPNFPQEEEKVLKYWQDIDAFKKQLELTKGKPQFTFYDGPPFATGLPHYGHIAAGTLLQSSTMWLEVQLNCLSKDLIPGS